MTLSDATQRYEGLRVTLQQTQRDGVDPTQEYESALLTAVHIRIDSPLDSFRRHITKIGWPKKKLVFFIKNCWFALNLRGQERTLFDVYVSSGSSLWIVYMYVVSNYARIPGKLQTLSINSAMS